MLIAAAALATAGVEGCNQKPNPPVEWPPMPDATWDAKQWPAACDVPAVCTKLRALGCPEGQPTTAGAACETWIPRYVDAGMVDGACICAADSVAAVRGCHVPCRQ